jgi:hypothetical protein
MFWKFVVGTLVLPSFLGLEIAAASLGKDNVQILPKSAESELSLAKTKESSTIPVTPETDTNQLNEGADIPIKISHGYRRRCYRRSYRRHYYRRRYYHPSYYRRRHYNQGYYNRHYYNQGYYNRHRHCGGC